MTEFTQCIGQVFARCQAKAQLTIAGKIAGTGQDQVAHAGQAHACFRPAAHLQTQSGEFSQTARDQGGAGIEAETKAIGDAGGNGNDVFDCAAQFDSDDIGAGIKPQFRIVQFARDAAGEFGIGAGDGQRGRQAARNFLGETGPGKDAGRRVVGPGFGQYGMRQLPAAGFQALA